MPKRVQREAREMRVASPARLGIHWLQISLGHQKTKGMSLLLKCRNAEWSHLIHELFWVLRHVGFGIHSL